MVTSLKFSLQQGFAAWREAFVAVRRGETPRPTPGEVKCGVVGHCVLAGRITVAQSKSRKVLAAVCAYLRILAPISVCLRVGATRRSLDPMKRIYFYDRGENECRSGVICARGTAWFRLIPLCAALYRLAGEQGHAEAWTPYAFCSCRLSFNGQQYRNYRAGKCRKLKLAATLSKLLHRFVEGGVELVQSGLGFVAHVGETERGAFDLAVAAVDEDALVFDEFLEFGDVHRAAAGFGAVVHAGERDGFVAFVREQIEAVARGPIAGHLREFQVAGITGVQALSEKVFELRGEGVNVADARRAGRHAAFGVLLEFDEVEIITAVLDGGGLGERLRRTREDGEAGRHGEGLLCAGEQDIDAERVKFDLGGGQRADGVHDEDDVGIFFLERGDLGERAHDAGGGFVMDERERIELAGGEFGVDLFGADGRTPFSLETFGLLAATGGDIEPLVRERAAHAVEDLFGHEIADGAFHDAPGGRGAEVDELLGVEQRLKLGHHLAVKVFEALAAMADHGRSKRAKGFLADFDRARNMEFNMRHRL